MKFYGPQEWGLSLQWIRFIDVLRYGRKKWYVNAKDVPNKSSLARACKIREAPEKRIKQTLFKTNKVYVFTMILQKPHDRTTITKTPRADSWIILTLIMTHL